MHQAEESAKSAVNRHAVFALVSEHSDKSDA